MPPVTRLPLPYNVGALSLDLVPERVYRPRGDGGVDSYDEWRVEVLDEDANYVIAKLNREQAGALARFLSVFASGNFERDDTCKECAGDGVVMVEDDRFSYAASSHYTSAPYPADCSMCHGTGSVPMHLVVHERQPEVANIRHGPFRVEPDEVLPGEEIGGE
jgi:hypothetical protein